MDEVLEAAAHEGLSVDLVFRGRGPTLRDLLVMTGGPDSRYPAASATRSATPSDAFRSLARFGFQQIDDFFGVPAGSGDGNAVRVWLYPVVDGEAVHHHGGPFTALRLDYNVLRNDEAALGPFLEIVDSFATALDVTIHYRVRDVEVDAGEALRLLRADAVAIVAYWRSEGITPGSDEALLVDY